MITKIEIKNVPALQEQTVEDFGAVNFIFGQNGSGKTTLTRIINAKCRGEEELDENIKKYEECSVEGFENTERVAIYNRDFVENNFKEKMAGVFTLGEQQKKDEEERERLTEEIEDKKKELKRVEEEIERDENDKNTKINTRNNELWNKGKNYVMIVRIFSKGFVMIRKNMQKN
jgi:AAA15 family ATPase/GTPase